MDEDFARRMVNLWRRLFSSFDTEALNSRNAIQRYLKQMGMDPNDIVLLPQQSDKVAQMITSLLQRSEDERRQREELEAKLDMLSGQRTEPPPPAAKPDPVIDPPQVADPLIADLRQQINTLELEITRLKRRAPVFSWSAETYQAALRLFIFERASLLDVSNYFGLKEGQISSKFYNRGPDEDLLAEPIEVRTEGPMSIMELWKIGHYLHGEGWRREIEEQFYLGKRTIRWNDPGKVLVADHIAALRAAYHERHAEKPAKAKRTVRLSPQADLVLAEIRKGGLEGKTDEELKTAIASAGNRTRRYDLLLKHHLIFDSQRKRGTAVWVAAEYRNHFPEAWLKAKQAS